MFKIKDGLSLGANTLIDASGNITVPGKTTLSSTTATAASLNLGAGVADPSAPTIGDFWNNNGTLKFYGATTKTVAYTDSNITGTAANVSTGTVAIANGGTNTTTTPTAGAVAYGSGTSYAFTAVGTSGQVLTSAAGLAPTWTSSTSANTFSAIVQRDVSGNFSAGTITATLSGTATNATNLTVTDDTATNATYYPSFALGTSSNQAHRVSSTKLTFNPSTGILASTGFSGSGSAITAINAANISTGTLAVARGGTAGNATPTAGAVAYGSGTAYAFTAVGTTGQVLASAAGSAPTWADQNTLSVGSATNATNSTNANNVAITADSASSGTHYVHFGAVTTGNTPVKISSSGLYFQPSTATLTVGGALTVGGNLTVNGTTTTVNSTTTSVDDPIFTIGGDTAPASDDNKDRGIEFRWHNGTSAKVGFFGYDDSTSKFTFVPDATNTSEVFSGTKGTIDANLEWADVLNKPDPVVTVTLSGDVTGTANTTLTDLASGTITVATTIAANSVALGTDTTGNYVATVAAGTPGVETTSSGLTISAAAGEGTAATIAHADTSTLSGAQGTAGISSVTLDGFGHVTGVTTATYLTAEADTLATVTGRGATTSTASSFTGGLTVGGTGIVYNGSTSGSATVRATATAGTTTITLPATTGTVVTTGDTGTVTSTMILDGTIVNADINAGAAISVSKLAASTISGITLGNNLANLTIGGNLTGTSYNGSSAVTVAVDTSTVALKADTHFIGTTSVALNRASANLALTGISSVTLPGATSGSVQIIPAAAAGTGTVLTLPATTGTVALNNQTFFIGTTSVAINRASANLALTGITSIDGYASDLAGGVLGSLPYQSAVNTTTLLSPNTTTTKRFLRSTGDGTNGTAPVWDTIVASDIPTLNQDTTGSAATLTTSRNINGVPFDGSTNITVTAAAGTLTGATLASGVTASSLTSVGTLTSLAVTGAITGTSFNSITGLSSTTPVVAGTAAVGIGTTTARADHVHPAQTTISGNAGTVTNGVYTNVANTLTAALTISNTAPIINLFETDQTLPAGRRRLVLDGNVFSIRRNTAAGGDFSTEVNDIVSDATGNFTSSGNITAYSDIRLKKDLVQIPDALSKVQQLTGYTYTRIDTGERQTGLVAQDVQKVIPEAVIDGDHMSVAYGNLVGLLVEAIKELKQEIEILKSK